MGRFVIAAYQPKPGKEDALMQTVRKHLDVLRAQKLVTDKSNYVMRASNGTVVEVFEWISRDAVATAHEIPAVLALWQEFEQVCTFVPLNTLPETADMFAEFDAYP